MAQGKPDIESLLDVTLGAPPTVEEFLEHFFAAAGGTQAVARQLYLEFEAAKPGSIIRARVLELIVRSLKFAEGKSKDIDMGLLTDDDLNKLVAEKLASIQGKVNNAKPAASPVP